MKQQDSILISIGNNIFSGRPVGFEDHGQRILLKQSDNSNITLSIGIQHISYIINMSGVKLQEQEKMKEYLVNCFEE